MGKAEDIEARIEAKRKAAIADSETQRVKDLEAFESLCEEHGYDGLARLMLPRYIKDLPTFLVVKAAPPDFVRLHRDKCAKGVKKGAVDTMVAIRAAAEVGRACVVYPAKEIAEEIKEIFPNLFTDAGAAALTLSKIEAQEEGNE